MIVTCESCHSSFELDDELVSESGSEVKCSKCDHTFTVFKPAPFEEREGGGPGAPEEQEAFLDLSFSDDETGDAEQEPDFFEQEPGDAEEKPESPEVELDLGAFDLDEDSPGEESGAIQEELDLDALSRALEEEVEQVEEKEQPGEQVLDFDLLDAEEKTAEAEIDLESIGFERDPAAEEFLLDETPAEAEKAPQDESADDISRAGLVETKLEKIAPTEEETRAFRAKHKTPPRVAPARPPVSGKTVGTPVRIFVVIGLLACGTLGAYGILKSLDIRIPFLESFVGVEETLAVDPGNLHIALPDKDITSRFVENAPAGRLFVIQGNVRNNYDTLRNFIVVRAALFDKDGKQLQEKTAYCGNTLSDKELRSFDQTGIEAKLRNKFGHERSNFRIPPGKAIPFVVVFNDVSRNLGEFAVEVVSSLPGE